MFICSVLLSTKDEAQVSITTPQTDGGLPVPRTATTTRTEGGLSVISKSLPRFEFRIRGSGSLPDRLNTTSLKDMVY